MLNFYRRFVSHAASKLLPLYELVIVGDEFEAAWTTLHDEHFQRSKVALATATYLALPSATAETCINTDASDTAVEAGTTAAVKWSLDAHIVFLAQTSRSRDQILQL